MTMGALGWDHMPINLTQDRSHLHAQLSRQPARGPAAINLQPDHAVGLSVAPRRDGDQPKELPKQRMSGINHANRLIA